MRLLKSIRNMLGNYQLKSGLYHYYRGESKQAIEFLTRAQQVADSSEDDRRMAIYYLTQTHIAAKFYSSQAHDMDTVEPPRGRIFVVKTLSCCNVETAD